MTYYYKPHSPEWFEALAAFNPMQAAMTKQMIAMSGRDDVCSVCGDDPAIDYKLNGSLPEKAVGTLRLCDDCHEIRGMAGEQFVKL